MASSYRQKFSKVTFRETDAEKRHPKEPVSKKRTHSRQEWNQTSTIKHRPSSAPTKYEASQDKVNMNEATSKYKGILRPSKEDKVITDKTNTIKGIQNYKSILKPPVVKQTHASKLRMSMKRPQSATPRVRFSDNLEQRKTFHNYRQDSPRPWKNIFQNPQLKAETPVKSGIGYSLADTRTVDNKTIQNIVTLQANLSSRPLPLPHTTKSKSRKNTSSTKELPSIETVEGLVKEDKHTDTKVRKSDKRKESMQQNNEVVKGKDNTEDTDCKQVEQVKKREGTNRTESANRQDVTIHTEKKEEDTIGDTNEKIDNEYRDAETSEVKLTDKTIQTKEDTTEALVNEDNEGKNEDPVAKQIAEVLSITPKDHRALLLTPTPPPEPEIPILDIQYCDIHRDKLVVYYCKSHSSVFCPACKPLKHSECKRIRTIKDACRWSKGDKEMKNVRGKLKALAKSINKINESRKQDQTHLMNEVSQCEQHISELMQKCNTVLNRFEKDLYTLLGKVDTAESRKLNDHTSAIQQVMGEMDDILKGIDQANKTNDDARIFLAMVKGKSLTNTAEKTIKDITENSYHIAISFEPENKVIDFLETVPQLGELKLSSVQHSKESMDLPHSVKNLKVVSHENHSIKMDEDITSCWITGSTFLTDGRLVLCDHFNLSIKLLDVDFTKQHQLEVKSRPWDVAPMGNSGIVVTLPEEQKLQFITVNEKLVPSWKKRTRRMCWGIAVYWDTIIITCHDYADGEVMILDKDGHFLEQICIDPVNNNLFTLPYYVAVSADGEKLFVTDQDSVTVTCLTMIGEVIYTFTNKEDQVTNKYSNKDIWLPEKLIVDEENNVLVCDYLTNTVIILTDDGKKHRTLVTFDEDLKDGVKKFTSLSYRQETLTLVLGLWNCDDIYVYNLTY